MAIKYKWLAGCLRELITDSIGKGIDRLPTEQELCRRYQVSRQTVRQSLSLLEQEGLITKKHGSGSYLTGRSSDSGKNVIGILISDDSDYLYPSLLHDLRTTLAQNGFSSEVFVTGNRICREREILEELFRHPLRGVIAEGCKSALPNPNQELYHRLIKKGCTVLFLHGAFPSLHGALCLKDDNLAGSRLLVSHLRSQGHTAIGGIFRSDSLSGTERCQGFLEAMYAAKLPVPDERILWYQTADLDRMLRMKDARFLREGISASLSSCTAVLCQDDRIAYYLIQELQEAGCTLPDDLAVTAFHNTYFSTSRILPVTALAHEPHETGQRAAQMLIAKLKGLPADPQEIPWKLVVRESSRSRNAQL